MGNTIKGIKMSKTPKILLASMIFILAGCARSPDKIEIQNANYGLAPDGDYQSTVKNFISTELKDPYSAMYKFESPTKFWISEHSIYNNEIHYGYLIKVLVNAKNSYGAYNGYKPVAIFWKNGVMNDITAWANCDGLGCMPHGYAM